MSVHGTLLQACPASIVSAPRSGPGPQVTCTSQRRLHAYLAQDATNVPAALGASTLYDHTNNAQRLGAPAGRQLSSVSLASCSTCQTQAVSCLCTSIFASPRMPFSSNPVGPFSPPIRAPSRNQITASVFHSLARRNTLTAQISQNELSVQHSKVQLHEWRPHFLEICARSSLTRSSKPGNILQNRNQGRARHYGLPHCSGQSGEKETEEQKKREGGGSSVSTLTEEPPEPKSAEPSPPASASSASEREGENGVNATTESTKDSVTGEKKPTSTSESPSASTSSTDLSQPPKSNATSSSTKSDKPIDIPPVQPANQLSRGIQLDSSSLLELLGPEKVDKDDVKLLREKVFGYTTFWITNQEPFGDSGEGVLLVGNLRANREEVFAKLQRGVKALFGEDKYDLFMVEEPNAEEGDPRGGPRVSFVLLRKAVSMGAPTKVWQYVIAGLLLAVTFGSCLELGLASQISRIPPDVVKYFTDPSPDPATAPELDSLMPYFRAALPQTYAVFGVQIFHEIGHRLAAARYKVKMGVPYLVPNITLGSFGGVTKFQTVCPDRTAQFDISVAGCLAGGGLSLAMLGLGLWLSVAPLEGHADDLVQVPSILFQGSLLLGSISQAVLGSDAMRSAAVSVHPLVIAGWCGLTTSAFNMLPVGCIDGGRAMQAAFGKRVFNVSGLVTYLLLVVGLLGGPLALPWGLYLLIVQRSREKPALNNVSEVGPWRKGLLVALLVLVTLTLLPVFDGGLGEDLGGQGMTML
eukprot:TRINITY_DN23649_c0_g1_i1.p1 TRINITY_DN23649_c0_g1~~TRINITY_DN23649_c0_g1_i1.p1  ORF type:complete len:752 (+),score=91.59 TRINITY_DN23649_c0_g1_i1:349-2604(+)